LVGTSVGSISKDIRYYLDRLVEKFPQHFEATVLDKEGKVSVVTPVVKKYEKDLLKWRWKQIREAAAAG
jgi:hypothetical protein